MIQIKNLVFGVAFFITGYSLNLLTNEQPRYTSPTSKSSNESSSLLLLQCEDKNLELANRTNEIKKLNIYTSSNEAAPTTLEKKRGKDSQAKEEVEEIKGREEYLKHQLSILSNYYVENEIKKQQEFLKSINASPENMPQALSENYEKDTIDNVWAPEKKALLDDYIAKNYLLRSLPNVESDCRSKQCKISILSDNPTALTQLAENLRNLTTNDFSTYTYTIDEKSHITSIYLDRKPTN